jgi:hypothetical protein
VARGRGAHLEHLDLLRRARRHERARAAGEVHDEREAVGLCEVREER